MAIIKIKSSKQEQNATDTVATTMQEEVQAVAAAPQSEMQGKRWQDPAVLKEYTGLTDAASRHFKLNNGTAKSIIGASPVNYFDETSQQWKSIDNSFTETAEAFETKEGKYKTQIYKPEQAKKVRLASGNIGLSWEYLGKFAQAPAVQTLSAAEQSVQPQTVLDVKPAQEGVLQNADGAAVYENADKDTDIEYIVHGGGIKENIIIKERAEEYKYLFALNTEGLKMRLSDDNGSLELYTESVGENGETVTKTEATIPAPFMYDANGTSNDGVYFELEPQQDGRYVFSVIADAEWINAEGRAFPVTVDPQIVTQNFTYLTKKVQYRNKNTSSSSGCYQTVYSDWYTTSSSYIKVLRNTSQEYKTTLTINKAGIPKLDYPVSSVKLQFYINQIKQTGYCRIGGKRTYVSFAGVEIADITHLYNAAESTITLVVEPDTTGNVDAEFHALGTNAPVLEVEYLINGKKKLLVQPFTLVGGLAGQYDITTGDASIAFEDVPASDSVLGLGISHVYKKSAEEHSVGKNFRLSLHETLSKTGAVALNADYVYTDATGMKHGFKDTYYYINASGQKISVSKSLVSVDLNGKLTYTTGGVTYDVKKEQRTKSGLTAITQYEDFKGVEWLEQRLDEQKQLEQQIEVYKNSISNYVIINSETGETIKEITEIFANYEEFELFLACVSGINVLVTKNEAPNYNQLQLDIVSESNEEQIRKSFKEYINLEDQKKTLVRQMPAKYLTDGKIVKGFNKDGNLVAVFDQYENSLTVEYDESGKIVNVYDGEDKQISFEYLPDGLLGSITDTRGRRTEYDYDDGKLISVKKSGGKELTLGYDTNEPDNLTSVTTSDKMQSELQYTDGLLSKVITKSLAFGIAHGEEPAAATTTISECGFSFGDNLTILTDDKGDKKYYKIDDLGDVYEYYAVENGLVVAAEKYDYVAYEKDNVLYAKKDSLYNKAYSAFTDADFTGGDTQNTVLDEFDNPATVTTNERALSTATTTQTTINYTYNDDHKCIKEEAIVIIKEGTSVLDKYTQITTYNYNAAGNVVRKESYIVGEEYTTGKSIEETEYDANGNAVRSFSYNSLDSSSKFYTESEVAENGQTLADFDETGENKTEYEYISGTNVVREEKKPNGSKFAYGYDENDVVTSISQSTEEGEENSTHTRYTCGEVTELVSGNNVVQYAYDGKRRLSKVELNGADYVTITTADATETTDETAHIDYIARGEDGKSDRYEVTKNKRGEVLSVKYAYESKDVDSPAYAEQYTNVYDAKNRVVQITQGGTALESNEYDDFERQTKHTFGMHVREIEYDDYSQTSKEIIKFGNSTTDKQEYVYTYKDNASRTLAGVAVGGFGESYEQDACGRGAKITQTLGGNTYTKRYGYYKQGDHATNRINAIYYGKNGVTDRKVTYTYDGMGNIISVNENGKQRYKYAYDKLNRIISEKDLYNNKEICYTYDNNGNILTKSIGGEITEYKYKEGSDRLVSFGTESIAYDNMGNPTAYCGMACTWEKGRRLTSITDGTNKIEYEYDVFGLRKTKKIYEPATAQTPTETVSYVYENGKLLRQITGSEVLTFVYGSEGVIGFTMSGSTEIANGNYLYRKNLFGDITGIINESGTLVYEYAYSAFGKSVEDEETGIGAKNPFRYRGYCYDDETGLYYLKSRYYDPETGRFITIDDISYIDPGTINGLNLYAYCGDNPVMRTDSQGTNWWNNFWNGVGNFFTRDIPNFFTKTIPNWWNGSVVPWWNDNFANFFTRDIPNWWNNNIVSFFIRDIPNFFTKTIPNLWNNVVLDWWNDTKLEIGIWVDKNLVSPFNNWLANAWNWLNGTAWYQILVKNIVLSSLSTGLGAFIGSIFGPVGTVAGTFIGLFAGFLVGSLWDFVALGINP